MGCVTNKASIKIWYLGLFECEEEEGRIREEMLAKTVATFVQGDDEGGGGGRGGGVKRNRIVFGFRREWGSRWGWEGEDKQ